MTPDYNLYSDHYYDKVRHPVRFYANHDMRMEMKLWQKLHEAGLMKLFMRTWAQTNGRSDFYYVYEFSLFYCQNSWKSLAGNNLKFFPLYSAVLFLGVKILYYWTT